MLPIQQALAAVDVAGFEVGRFALTLMPPTRGVYIVYQLFILVCFQCCYPRLTSHGRWISTSLPYLRPGPWVIRCLGKDNRNSFVWTRACSCNPGVSRIGIQFLWVTMVSDFTFLKGELGIPVSNIAVPKYLSKQIPFMVLSTRIQWHFGGTKRCYCFSRSLSLCAGCGFAAMMGYF